MIQAVLFDLDGTLADTATDLGEAINRLLRLENKAELPMSEIRPIASYGANGLLEKAFNIDKSHPEHALWRNRYLDEYAQCLAQSTVLFPQVNGLIDAIVARGLSWGIVTNKPERFTTPLLPHLGLENTPEVVISCGGTPFAKPHTRPMFEACTALNVLPEACVYVGDAQFDMVAGKNAGMKTVLVNWGYLHPNDDLDAWPIDARIDSPMALLPLLDTWCL